MEGQQLERRISWLDEQRRKDTEVLDRLSDRIASLEKDQDRTAQRLQDMTDELARMAALATRINQFDEAMSRNRKDFSQQLASSEKRRSEKEKHFETIWRKDIEALGKDVAEQRKKLESLGALREQVEARRQEAVRLTSEIDKLSKKLEQLAQVGENHVHDLSKLADNQRQENQRLGQVQAGEDELRLKLEGARGDLEAVQERARRLEAQVSEIGAAELEREEVQSRFVEAQSLRMVDFERDWKEWEGKFHEFQDQVSGIDERIQAYEDTYRALKQQRVEIDKVIERFERRIGEITEMQRLSEDRGKQDWANFLAEDQKRWSTHKLTQDERWREHDRVHEKLARQIDDMRQILERSSDWIENMSATDRKRVMGLLALIREWVEESENTTSSR
jgi:chromosome segregation ATPase